MANRSMIRPVEADDRADLYSICLATGAAGEDAARHYVDHELLGHVYAGPYVALDDTIGFVYEDEVGVAGYVLAALDTASFEDQCEQDWWPPLRALYPDPHLGNSEVTSDEYWDARLVDHIWNPPRTDPEIVEQFPAHLHIDLLPRLQGKGIGRELITMLLAALKTNAVTGLHFGVDPANKKAIGFYEHLGFTQLSVDDGVMMAMRLTDQLGQVISGPSSSKDEADDLRCPDA